MLNVTATVEDWNPDLAELETPCFIHTKNRMSGTTSLRPVFILQLYFFTLIIVYLMWQ